MADSYVSLAASTATAIESASKHNLQCKVSTDHIIQWLEDGSTSGESATAMVKKDKMNYCMHKNDLVVCVKQGWFPFSSFPPRAYPNVITTCANMCQAAQYWVIRLYNNAKDSASLRFVIHDTLYHKGSDDGEARRMPLKKYEQTQIDLMPQFSFQGVSLGLAYAHPDSGDTVGTVMMGGLRTVLNGHFKANTGQPVMWYFEFEAPCFNAEGKRIFANQELPNVIEDGIAMITGQMNSAVSVLDMKTLDRKRWHDRENANFPGHYAGKRNVIMCKPYVRNDDYGENILDRERVFGIYISSAREFEQVDLKLQRQAI